MTNSRSSSSVQDTALILCKALREREESEKWQTQEQDQDSQHCCWWSLDSVLSWPYWFQPCRYCYNCAAIANQLYSGEYKIINLLFLLLKHLLYRMVVRIMVMVPLYAISSLISLFSVEAAFFIDAIRDIYEVRLFSLLRGVSMPLVRRSQRTPRPTRATMLNHFLQAFVIYCFFVLLLSYLGGERSLLILLHGRPPKIPVFPVNLFKSEIDVSDPYTFLFLKRGILREYQD